MKEAVGSAIKSSLIRLIWPSTIQSNTNQRCSHFTRLRTQWSFRYFSTIEHTIILLINWSTAATCGLKICSNAIRHLLKLIQDNFAEW